MYSVVVHQFHVTNESIQYSSLTGKAMWVPKCVKNLLAVNLLLIFNIYSRLDIAFSHMEEWLDCILYC